jgi:hypothetical protein
MSEKQTRQPGIPVGQAIKIALLVLDWESEQAAAGRGHRDEWARECRQAAALFRAMVIFTPPGGAAAGGG